MEKKSSQIHELGEKTHKLEIRKLKFARESKEKNNKFYSRLGEYLNESYF